MQSDLQEIPGFAAVVKWFGHWPSFHDAEILELHFDRANQSWIKIHMWLMSEEPGKLKLRKHAIVTFTLEQVIDLELN